MSEPFDAIIIGAGAAGLAAGRELHHGGRRVLIVEARDRIGGRIFTRREAGLQTPIELGAEFVHGKPKATLDLIEKAGLSLDESRDVRLFSKNGKLMPLNDFWSLVQSVNSRINPDEDITYQEFLDKTDAPDFAKRLARSYAQGLNAARAETISARAIAFSEHAAASTDGGRNFRVTAGYDAVIHQLARQIPEESIRLSDPVLEVKWKPGSVEIRTTGTTYSAKNAIITVPLGVLRAGTIIFDPPLTTKAYAFSRLEMGHVVKAIVYFRKRWWEKTAGAFGYAISYDAPIPTWWTQLPARTGLLTGWAAGPAGEDLAKCQRTEILSQAVTSLSRIFGVAEETIDNELVACHFHNWSEDPFSLGAYSYPAVGGIEAARQLAQPVESTLFFAGEATDFSGHHGTVHGAIASGYRAADEIIAQTVLSAVP